MIRFDYERYGVPRVIHNGQSRLRLEGGKAVVNTLKISPTKQLDFYSNLGKADTLIVSFHGAYNGNNPGTYPMFWRIKSLSQKTGAFLAFTDPTRLQGGEQDILVSWFLGKQGWDPQSTILSVVENAMKVSSARRVMFVGGSGGGFAALRASAAVPGSCAFVQDATVGLDKHNPIIVRTYFKKAWPDWDEEKLIKAFPELFNMTLHYRRRIPGNFVFMTQSLRDKAHLNKHFVRFARAHGIPETGGESLGGGRVLKAYSPKVPGHGKITSAEFESFLDECMSKWMNWENKKKTEKETQQQLSQISLLQYLRNLLSTKGQSFRSLSSLDFISKFRRSHFLNRLPKFR